MRGFGASAPPAACAARHPAAVEKVGRSDGKEPKVRHIVGKRFEGRDGKVEKLIAARVEWHRDGNGPPKMVEIPGSEFEIPADLVLFAMGFLGPVQAGLLEQFGVERDARTKAAGAHHECERMPNNTVACTGDNSKNQLADGTTYPQWWKQVYVSATHDGEYTVQHFKGRLPYHLHTRTRTISAERPHRLRWPEVPLLQQGLI